jgi:hypothetical protein
LQEPLCHGSEPGGEGRRERAFVCAPYVADEHGRMRPLGKVTQCPFAAAGEECWTHRNGFRGRKTGPCFPIQVMGCRVHECGFTVYPMGFDPYGRVRLAPVDAGGSMLEAPEGEAEVAGVEPRCDVRWQGTIFHSGGVGRGLGDAAVAARGDR